MLRLNIILTILLFSLISFPLSAKSEMDGGLGIHTSFNNKDFFLGASGDFLIYDKYGILLSPFISFRPFKKNIFKQLDDNVLYQFQETRINFGTTISTQYVISKGFGILASLGPCYSISNFHGLKESSNSQFAPVVRSGFYYRLENTGYDLTAIIQYEYMPLSNTPDHRFYAGFQIF